MKVAGSPHVMSEATVKLKTWSAAMAFGGSSVSSSVTLAATTVTVHVSPPTKFAVGSSVKLPGPPDAVAGWLPLVAQLIEYQPSVTLTGSLKVIVRFAQDGTPVALAAGNVDATRGAESCGSARVRRRR